jgi:hypothetical protein
MLFRWMRHRLRRLSGIALLAVFGLVFAPTISHALAHGGNSAWAEVCTPQGMKLVALDEHGVPDTSAPPSTTISHLDHCPLCGLGAAALPRAAPAPWASLPGLRHTLPRLFLQAPRTLFAWAAPPSRGPPHRT